jgi:uncharacterized protein YdeI (YjbR/CyaY-like superfamily)
MHRQTRSASRALSRGESSFATSASAISILSTSLVPVTTSPQPLTIHLFEDSTAWETWLETNHGETSGIWLKISKKGAGVPSVTYDEAINGAICFGWIDGQRKSHDEQHFLQKFTPRRKNSMWSKRNVDKVEVLTKAGRIRGPGQAEIDAAKADGRWEKAYSSSSTMQVADDFQAALDRNQKARAFFEALNRTQRYSFLWRIETAKRSETRRRRIEQYIDLLKQHKTL